MSTKNKPTILVTDDEKSIRNTLREILEYEEYTVEEAKDGKQALEKVSRSQPDLMLLDIKMAGLDGLEVLDKLAEHSYEFPVIMLSGNGTIEIAVEAIQKGAYDFLEKPPDLNRLLVSVKNALDRQHLVRENKAIRNRLPEVQPIIGESKAIQQIKTTIDKVAPTEARVLITGENGTGKELVARWIHEKSKRCSGPFVEVNCAAIPKDLLESELFGHEKGAFTGATSRRIGKFEQADGGTIFLDEIGDMALDAQAKVLRVLQESVIHRVGGTEGIDVDVRVLAATNKDLNEEIEEGRFREDLYHRLNVIPIQVPPLRERAEDIPLLAQAFLEQLAKDQIHFEGMSFDKDALKYLKTLPWSGNVRELHNIVERVGILSSEAKITKDVIESMMESRSQSDSLEQLASEITKFQDFKESAERLFLIHHLEKNNWNISQTAESIDIQRSHLYTKMKKYEIER
ncbi:MAG: sigma-54-dependent transcriptional regulator [Bacteroidota bacterium]